MSTMNDALYQINVKNAALFIIQIPYIVKKAQQQHLNTKYSIFYI